MTVTPEQFFSKNLKWIVLVLAFLLLFSLIKSCNRKMSSDITTKQYTQQIDSLTKLYNNYKGETQDSIKKLNFELQLAKQQTKSADERASAVQSAVEKIKSNTTITVKGAEEVKDNQKRQ
jgi:hypothetical protein